MANPDTPTFLLCTVGGSHEPLLTAIRTLAPERVVFVCSGTDPATGQKGSEYQILGKGEAVKARDEDERPSLPNIPAQAGLPEGRFEVLRVPPDELDPAFIAIEAQIAQLCTERPQARIVADYTGGTKTMSAALKHPRVELQLVTGSRANLVRVPDGTQYAVAASADGIRIGRSIKALRGNLWAFAGAAYRNPTSICPRHHMMLPRIIRG